MLDNNELIKIGNNISKWVEIYKKQNQITKDKLYTRIYSNCFQYTYFFIILRLKDDEIAAKYTNFLMKKLDNSIKKFNTEKGSFTNFWNSLIISSIGNFKSTLSKENHINELYFDTFNDDNDNLKYEVNFDKEESYKKDYSSIKLTEKDKQRILAFLLTQARDIDDMMIENISSLLGYDEIEIRGLIEEVIIRDNISNNTENEIEREEILRNYYYSRSLGLQRKNEYQPLSDNEKRILKKCNKNLDMHNLKIAKLSTISQKTVAEVLNMKYSTIRGSIFKAKKLLEKIGTILEENNNSKD